jgi:hypothetical protein
MISPVEGFVCRMLCGELPPHQLLESDLLLAWEHATFASVDELLAQLLTDARPAVPASIAAMAASRLRDAHAREMMRFDGLRALTAAFASSGVRMLLMKGAGVAYTLYPAPHLRPSDDVDILIARADLDAAASVLERAGYTRQVEPDAELASMQRHYAMAEGDGFERIVDLHWAVANRHAFVDVIAFEEAWASSRTVGALNGARTLGSVEALLLACTHRVAHHDDSPSLLWMWDIHLLASRLTAADAEAVVHQAERGRVAAVVAHSLQLAQARFGTPFDRRLLDRLRTATGEPSAQFIGGSQRPVDLLTSDLRAAGSLGRRLRLLREHLFPPPAYMRTKYPGWPGVLLPLAYVHRAWRGAPRWFRRG